MVNFGYTYPIYSRRFPNLNDPLVELAYQTWKAKGERIVFVDVGAATGDTVLLLYANLPTALAGFVCIDGDAEFFQYLQHNLGHLPEGRFVNCLLSARDEDVSELVRTHAGTASAQGRRKKSAATLSCIVTDSVDMIKIDVDGLDGRVLSGSRELLARCHPSIIFEWHPILCQQTGNSWTEHFAILAAEGYSRFIWFTKYGNFSHFTIGASPGEVDELAKYCLADVPSDWHYDVVALHDSSAISLQELSRLSFAHNRHSRW